MALSHLCPSSLSQLNELFPRQIKTGETAFSKGRRLGIQMGASWQRWQPGPPRALLWAVRGKGKPVSRKACLLQGEKVQGAWGDMKPHLASAQGSERAQGNHWQHSAGAGTGDMQGPGKDWKGGTGSWQGGEASHCPGSATGAAVCKCQVSALPAYCFLSLPESSLSKVAEQAGGPHPLMAVIPSWWSDLTPAPSLLQLQGQCISSGSFFWNLWASSSLQGKQVLLLNQRAYWEHVRCQGNAVAPLLPCTG